MSVTTDFNYGQKEEFKKEQVKPAEVYTEEQAVNDDAEFIKNLVKMFMMEDDSVAQPV